MTEFTLLTKGIFSVFILFVIYKTEIYKVVINYIFGIVDRGFKKLNSLNGVRMEYCKDTAKRQKYINNMFKKKRKNSEI